jgi:hypothetical protein
METVKKIKSLIVVYLALIVFLLLCVAATPLFIRHGLAIGGRLIIEEEYLESALIVAILSLSCVIVIAYRRTLEAYRRAVARAGEDKSRLASRLTEAFSYIGSVNIGLKEIQSIVCGIDHYPQTRKEFKHFLHELTTKIMTDTGAAWVVVRIIDPCSGRTIKGYTAQGRGSAAPTTIGEMRGAGAADADLVGCLVRANGVWYAAIEAINQKPVQPQPDSFAVRIGGGILGVGGGDTLYLTFAPPVWVKSFHTD